MTLSNLLKDGNMPQVIYESRFHDYLRQRAEEKNKIRSDTFHASSLADKHFCIVKSVIEQLVPKKEDSFPPQVLSTFHTGDDVHNKHQTFYLKSDMADYVEQTYFSETLDMTATPDGVLQFMGLKTISEIKSMNGFEFGKLKEPPTGAYAQAQIYMYVTASPQAIIVIEDKNFQKLKVFLIEFELEHALVYVKRRRAIMKCVNKNIVPLSKRICKKKSDRKRCKFNDICWSSEVNRLGTLK